jgi:DNA-binding MurR/RpiR family transcriptional regulator
VRLCHTEALTNPARTPELQRETSENLREHLDERDIAALITTDREGATTASLAAAHGVSLTSVTRFLHIAGVRQNPPTRRDMTAISAATHP